LNVLAAVSLVMLVAVVGMWASSYLYPFQKEVEVFAPIGPNGGIVASGWAWWVTSQDGRLDIRPRYSFYEWNITYWKLLLASAILPARRFVPRRWLDRPLRRRERGQCPGCGYDLRATPERCPECGMVIKPTA
jgi:hypothetical protein